MSMSLPLVPRRLARRLAAWRHGPRTLPAGHKLRALEACLAFSVANNMVGDYLEFGVFEGASFIHAHQFYKQQFERYRAGQAGTDAEFLRARKRFVAFDSFAGLPDHDEEHAPLHWRGQGIMRCEETRFRANLKRSGVDLSDVVTVPGYFDQSLTEETRRAHGLERAAVVNVDCDLHSSTVQVLDFLGPLLVDGTTLYFDDYFYYKGHPARGERGAFEDWLSRNPQWAATELCKMPPAAAFILHQV